MPDRTAQKTADSSGLRRDIRTVLGRAECPARRRNAGRLNTRIAAGEAGAAVIVAQTACEVLGKDVLRRLMRQRGVDFMADWAIDAAGLNTSFSKHRVRRLYVMLSGDEIHNAPFWAATSRTSN